MATKQIELAGVGPVTLIKRAGSRSLRLSVAPNGTIRVSMPRWTPYSAGQAFALHNLAWIQAELAKQSQALLEAGQRIGKLHYLRFEQVLGGQPTTSRVTGTEVVVRLKPSESSDSPGVQKRAHAACVRALKREAERLLPPRLQGLATKHGREYSSVGVKLLKRRWGSCDAHQAITLNLFLMELPWDFIDYVLLHELAHTVEMNHGDGFWRVLLSMQPRARDLSRQLRKRQPAIGVWPD
ncbi:MAG TPA: SprT family zinc-dependent metalloprotease [Candidatus Saccharimonadales bacterium]|nr:SprT family zinc-dependent metalloprotease [Candidatus Saccharimonadales bacterium]